ncbi:MAG TPA: biosynthetic-type acetolactate synthase large subunit [Candidatus Gallacutalibacter stercoravium]|nr:biosynthetic-type acetolactate synthase large subunit [Candidatus Gallacutalibacter stercoravium]
MPNGAQIMVKCLENEGVSVVFGYPGAAICPFYDALLDSNIRHILVRQEQNAGHAASGYARACGKPGVCVATSGPGATNLVTGLATAYMDSIPIVAITGQVRSDLLGRDVFQEVDITGCCEPFTKHSYLVKRTEDLPRVFKEAFHIATTGRPGPVLIDIPIDIQQNTLEHFVYPEKADIIGYKPRTQGHPLQIKRAAELIQTAKRPLLFAGGGVLSSGAKRDLVAFAEETGIPVVSTMMGIGVMPSEHPLYLGMLGSHGVPAANRAIHEADVLILCGARVGDRAVASPDQITEKAKVIHIDIDPAEIGKNMKAHIPIVGNIRLVLGSLREKVRYHVPEDWANTVQDWKANLRRCPQPVDGFVEPRTFIRDFSGMLPSKAILVADVGQNQIWCANNFKIREGRFLTTGGMGTMGYSLPAAVGAKVARPSRQVVAVCGDGAFQMCMNELGTIAQNHLGVKIIIMRNVRLGMVRELQDKQYQGRHAATILDETLNFRTIASAYGIPSADANSNEEALQAARNMLATHGPYLLVCNVSPDTPSI